MGINLNNLSVCANFFASSKRNKSSMSTNTINPIKTRRLFTLRGVLTRWMPISVGVYAVWLYKRGIDEYLSEVEVKCYTYLPLRIVSKVWGSVANIDLPASLRPYVYGKYSKVFKVNLEEVDNQDFSAYESLASFFVRKLKPDARAIDFEGCLIAPCDGKVLHCGPATSDTIEQVKGITYSLKDFIGEITWNEKKADDYYDTIMTDSKNNILHQCVIYLAPGDYHRFHSPCDWKAVFRRHFSGKLLSVNPIFAKLIPDLFCVNERVVYVGEWEYGFFSFSPIGATNVGSIEVYKDKELHTNGRKLKWCEDLKLDDFKFERGEMTGQFNMGSTIVLIFEAPRDFEFTFIDGDRVKMGQKLGYVKK